jgi:hypothetical protein
MRNRYFGVEEANRLVPHLARTFETVRGWVARLEALKEALASAETSEARVFVLRAECEEVEGRIRQELEQLEELGVEVKAVDGLVDFRALRGEQVVYLCWRFGEAAITYWHTLESGFAGRQPIRRGEEFARTWVS